MTPFELDTHLKEIAEANSWRVSGRLRISVDEKALPSYLFKRQPDWQKIRSLVAQGVEVPGVTVGKYEYVVQEHDKSEENKT